MTCAKCHESSVGGDESGGKKLRSPLTLFALGLAIVFSIVSLMGLGFWQLERRVWKLALIEKVEQRVHASPLAVSGPSAWPGISADSDEYRHVSMVGYFLNDRETLVQAVTELGGGFWVLTPFKTVDGYTVLVNRGFVPPEKREAPNRAAGQIAGKMTVTGLLRLTEAKGGFLRSNDPQADRWYSRDVGAIAAVRGLSDVAPFFIDADAGPDPEGFPRGGLTVLSFPNNHLVYALTWFGMALMLAGAAIFPIRDEWRMRRRRLSRPVAQHPGSLAAWDGQNGIPP